MHCNHHVAAFGLMAVLASPVAAFWRLPCTAPIVVAREDPIVSPGLVSNHVHTIMGGNGFSVNMTYESTQASTCSSCTVMGDFSNYWVPQLYYQYPNGSFKSVDQAGGATVYYIQRGEEGEELFAFPEGLRMVAGNPFKRSPGNDFASQAISFGCLNFNEPATPETPNFPTTNCPDGLRSQVFFPSCWDGVNLDSADHMSHMSYPTTEYNNGPCPSTHPKHLISLFYEVTWNVNDFKDMWYGDKQPFVFSSGDPTGYGGHGDFFCGWNVTLLQTAVDECTNSSGKVEDCHVFNLTPDNVAEGCIVPSQVDEPVLGNLDKLPGCQTVDAGPATAPIQSNCGAVTTLSAPKQNYFSDLTSSLKWSYVGCGTDNYYNRILTGASESNDNMTVENCVNFCSSKGFSIAGTEYAQECYCGNSIPASGAPVPGVIGQCMYPCSGDSSEFCGGWGTISLYQKCADGKPCTNAQFGPSSSPPGGSNGGTESPPPSPTPTPATNASNIKAVENPSPPTPPTGSTNNTGADVVTGGAKAPAGGPDPALPTPPGQPNTISTTTTTTTSSTTDTASATPQLSFTFPSPVPSGANITLPSDWKYAGCYVDAVNPRSLTTWANFGGDTMSSTQCVEYCDGQGYPVAGTEYSTQCFCGRTLDQSAAAPEADCNMPCAGAQNETCGGPARLSVWASADAAQAQPAQAPPPPGNGQRRAKRSGRSRARARARMHV